MVVVFVVVIVVCVVTFVVVVVVVQGSVYEQVLQTVDDLTYHKASEFPG